MRQTGLRYCQSGGQPWLAGMCHGTNGMRLLPVASCPWLLRELSQWSCSLCGSFTVCAAEFSPPLCCFLQIASIKGETQGSFPLLWACSHIGSSVFPVPDPARVWTLWGLELFLIPLNPQPLVKSNTTYFMNVWWMSIYNSESKIETGSLKVNFCLSTKHTHRHRICHILFAPTLNLKFIQCYISPLVAQKVKNLPAMQETQVWSLGWEDPLEEGMATYSSILAWRILWTEGPGWLPFVGLQRVGHDWATNTFTYLSTMWWGFLKLTLENSFESVLMRWMKLEPIIQSKVSQKEQYWYSVLTHIYGI